MHGTDGDTDPFKKDIHEFYDIEDELGRYDESLK